MLTLRRITVPRRLPTAVVSWYTNGRTEGSVAQSKGFNKKEKAHEDQYVHQHEMELLKKMKQEIENKQKELDALQKEHAELAKDAKE